MSSTAVLVQVDLPAVEVPSVDLAEVRSFAAVLEDGAERLAASAYRLGGASSLMAGGLGWCGPASSAFLGSCAEQRAWFGNAWAALGAAGATCRRYADALEPVTDQARQALARANQIGSELVDLREQVRQIDLRRAAAPTSGPAAVSVFTTEGDTSAEVRRLQAWAERLAGDARAVQTAVQRVDDAVRQADAVATAAFDRVAAMTFAARNAQAARALAAAQQLVRPAEDGSLGSRFGGLFGGLREDVTGPLSLIGGLVGLDGGVGQHWSALGSALSHGVTHPVDLGESLADWDDIEQGDWGHWVGTVGPSAAASLFTGGGYAALKSAEALELLAGSDALAAKVADLAELAAHAGLAQAIADHRSVIDAGLARDLGLVLHEAAGGHTMARHVGLSDEDLVARLKKYRTWTASTFPDLPTAERVVADVLEAEQADIVAWLVSKNQAKDLVLSVDLGREVGTSLKKGQAPMHVRGARVTLVRDESALGFHIITAYPLRPQ